GGGGGGWRRRRDGGGGPREAPLPEPGADPDDSRPLDRQVHRAPRLGAVGAQDRAGGKGMATGSKAGVATTQVYEVYIKASPEAIWDAITSPEWTVKYGYQGSVEYELRLGGRYRARSSPEMLAIGIPEVVIDGVVERADPPTKLVHTYRFLVTDAMKAEGFTRVTWEIEKVAAGFSRLTVVHELEGAPIMAGMVASKFSEQGTGGWAWILSDLKTVLETGSSM